MNLLLRLALVLIQGRHGPWVNPFDTISLQMRVWPTDLDVLQVVWIFSSGVDFGQRQGNVAGFY